MNTKENPGQGAGAILKTSGDKSIAQTEEKSSKTDLYQAAMDYLQAGFSLSHQDADPEDIEVVRSKKGDAAAKKYIRDNAKRPKVSWKKYQQQRPTEEEIRSWFADCDPQRTGIGIVTGEIGGVCVVDADTDDAVEFVRGNFPSAPMVRTGNGAHLYYRYVAGLRNFAKRDDLPGIDFRGEGGYVVAPPSPHYSGRAYTWDSSLADFGQLPLPPVESLVPTKNTPKKQQAVVGEESSPFFGVCEGGRNDAAASVCGRLVAAGLDGDALHGLMVGWNQGNSPPLENHELKSIIYNIKQTHARNEFAAAEQHKRALDGFEFADGDIHVHREAVSDWPFESAKGRPLNVAPNLAYLLNHYGFVVRYDVIRKLVQTTWQGMNTSSDNQNTVALSTITSLAALNGLPQSNIANYLVTIADQRPYNPVMAMIESTPWDGKSRLPALLETIRTSKDLSREFLSVLVLRWLVAAVAAAAKPSGFFNRGVLVLQGPQGCGKTTWITRLAPPELRDLVKDGALIDPRDKDSIIPAVSRWIVELGELDATFRRADIARLKAFISSSEDQLRRPYGAAYEKYQRRTVFAASVNTGQFLVDTTGNTRFWTIPVTGLDFNHDIDVQQLWAEVYTLYQAGERWWLNAAEEDQLNTNNRDFEQPDGVSEAIADYFGRARGDYQWLSTSGILSTVGIGNPSRAQLSRAGEVLSSMGFNRRKTNAGRKYHVPVGCLGFD